MLPTRRRKQSDHHTTNSNKMCMKSSKEDTVVEQDNGFHVVEIHAPTMGISIIAIVVILAILALAHSCASRLRKKYLRRPRQDQQGRLPFTHPYPMFMVPEQYQP